MRRDRHFAKEGERERKSENEETSLGGAPRGSEDAGAADELRRRRHHVRVEGELVVQRMWVLQGALIFPAVGTF